MTQQNGLPDANPPPVDRLTQLWRRVNEHKIVQWSVAYIAVAYAVQHAVELTGEAFEWPPSVLRVSMLLMVLGLPVVLTLAWYHGERASRHFSAAELTIISLLLVIGSVVFYAFVQPQAEVADGRSAVQETGLEKARAAADSAATGISVAVLPFTNLSSDPEQEFFSDGMTEEITAALAKVPDLRVVARTSAFEFKGQNRNIESIGQQLKATHLIEGSVRKAGDRVRITVQLIKANDGTHVWSENYDRQLTDVFAIQEEIARTVTASFNMSLSLKPGENLVNNRGIDPASYEKYLRAIAIYNGRGGRQTFPQAASFLEEVVATNPRYAPAWAWLGVVKFTFANDLTGNSKEPVAELRARVNELRENGEAHARRAIQLDPAHATGHVSLGLFTWARGKPLEAEEHFLKALSLDPASLNGYGIRLAAAGRLKEALALMEKGYAIEPLLPQVMQNTAHDRWLNGLNDDAISLAKTMRPANRAPVLAMIYASMGRFSEAADALLEISSDPNSDAAAAARLLRMAPTKALAPEALPRLPTALEFVYLYVGAPDRAIDNYERRAEIGFFGSNSMAFVWHPSYAPIRKTERFKTIVRKAGLVEYWRVKGWPEFCRPVGADDFACS